jgi:hypothetical protein
MISIFKRKTTVSANENRLIKLLEHNRDRVVITMDGRVRLNLQNKDVQDKIMSTVALVSASWNKEAAQ